MTEAEWLACADPEKLITALGRKASKRKRRLFACACCRRIWPLIADERSRSAVVVAEQFADALVGEDELVSTDTAARKAYWEAAGPTVSGGRHEAAGACRCVVSKHAGEAVGTWNYIVWAKQWQRAAERDTNPEKPDFRATMKEVEDEETPQLASLLREIFGNPFRRIAADSSWLTSTVVALARGIYADRAFDRLPILADALQDAGCENADILTHLRGNDPHVRGCWALDLILGKQ
jgi:hypothetical protein